MAVKAGRTFSAYMSKVFHAKNGKDYTKFSVSDSAKNQAGEWESKGWYSIMVEGNYPCEKKSGFKFKINTVDSVEQEVKEDGKIYVTIWATIEVSEWGNVPHDDFQAVDMLDEDLPF